MNASTAGETPKGLGTLARLVIGFGGFLFLMAALFFLVIGIENWRGHRAWTALQEAHRASGDSLAIDAVIPPPVPSEQNFAETPMLKPLLQYRFDQFGQRTGPSAAAQQRLKGLELGHQKGLTDRLPDGRVNLAGWQEFFADGTSTSPTGADTPAEGVLLALQRWDAEMAEIESASRRPASRFDIHYQEGYMALLPHLSCLKTITTLFELRSAAYLSAEKSQAAEKDVVTAERVANSLNTEPLLISMLVQYADQTIVTRMLWQGLIDHRWNEDQLERLQALFASRIDPRKRFSEAVRAERAFSLAAIDSGMDDMKTFAASIGSENGGNNNGGMEAGLRLAPRGWLRQNQVSIAVYYDEIIRSLSTNVAEGTADDAQKAARKVLDRRPKPYALLANMLVPSIDKAETKSYRMLAINRMAQIACALERHRIANKAYPDTLEKLIPQFLAKVPLDPITEQPFHYQPQDGDWYRLYSVGPNRIDDQGAVHENIEQGDWVWPSPSPAQHRLF